MNQEQFDRGIEERLRDFARSRMIAEGIARQAAQAHADAERAAVDLDNWTAKAMRGNPKLVHPLQPVDQDATVDAPPAAQAVAESTS